MNHKGSYLLEMVFLITIITSFLLFIPVVRSSDCEIKKNNFVKTLNTDIQYGLTYSITHVTLIKIYIIPDLNLYILRDGDLEQVIKRYYPNDLLINSSFIEISHGYVLNTVSLSLSCNQKTDIIKINEKSGRIDG